MERYKIWSHGQLLVVANRDRLLPTEVERIMPEVHARAEIEGLPPESTQVLVRALGWRFPNEREPLITERVMHYVGDRVAAGSLVVLVQPRSVQ